MRSLLTVLTLSAAAVVAQAQESISLYDPANYRPLVSDQKAIKAGDLLTVVIQESASASSSADSRGGRSTGLSIELEPWSSARHDASIGLSSDSEGGGRTERAGRLLAQLTVSVLSVLPNGDLVIYGRQGLRINGESQEISLRGRVRVKDITDGNLVASSRIADADIKFEGEGFIAEKSRPGWLSQFLALFGL